jgi:anhydro-N-acetylmuramic acid kinase
MSKSYYSLGLMSGTSMDGIDASIIQSDGESNYKPIIDEYFEYPKSVYEKLTKLRDKIKTSKDLSKESDEIKSVEKDITLFHANAVNKIISKSNIKIDFIGFHGQTIFHNSKEKISTQLGNAHLLSKLTKKTVLYNFRENDLKNGGEGAPLTPIFHSLLKKNFKLKSAAFFNIGGIVNESIVRDNNYLSASDVGPGMCLIDKWIRNNSKGKHDINGDIARNGKINKKILENEIEIFFKFIKNEKKARKSFDISNFDNSFVKSLSMEDGAATLTEYTAQILLYRFKLLTNEVIILCGGGRKNKFLIERIKQKNISLSLIDDFRIDGDFVESQAFAYIAIRSYIKIPISFPLTTGVNLPCEGGDIIKI